MPDIWMERLSEYLDGAMDRSEREALEAHLTECPECSGAIAELRQVRARARELSEMPVPKEIWSRIERAIGGTTPVLREPGPVRITRLGGGGGFSFSLPQLLAACLAVAIVSGGATFAVLHHPPARVVNLSPVTARAPEATPAPRNEVPTETTAEPSTVNAIQAVRTEQHPEAHAPAETPHEEAISELRKVLARNRAQLDPATIRTLETNLAIIDLAIDQARRALVADSANTYVKEHLAETMRRKVELLQRATMLASTSESEGSR
jgi:anti-sigma factor RsiW